MKMITIIKEGCYVPKNIIPHYSIKCDGCHAIFECDKSDTCFKMVGHGEGGQYIHCPKCGRGISEIMNQKWKISNLDEIRAEEERRWAALAED